MQVAAEAERAEAEERNQSVLGTRVHRLLGEVEKALAGEQGALEAWVVAGQSAAGAKDLQSVEDERCGAGCARGARQLRCRGAAF